MPLSISLDDKVAIVTGASSGIGAAIARAMAMAGASVVAVGRSTDRLQEVVDDIHAGGGVAHQVAVDLTDEDAPDRIVATAVESFGGVDCLVHCAGVLETGPSDDSLAALDRQWATNVRAPVALTVAALCELRRRRGNVIFLSSISGKVGFAGGAAYCATKGAIEMFTKALAVEEAPAVRVNAIAPGNVETAMNAHLMADPDYKRAVLAATPLGRNGQVEDIAPIAVLLASGAASWMTGQSVVVDGGATAQ
jgi:NAD(P)-dependent dehydrogenase (short-subunit alcohol dehydrogenase family)